jgi:hypothetical protein
VATMSAGGIPSWPSPLLPKTNSSQVMVGVCCHEQCKNTAVAKTTKDS